jgi:hypothetical protein
MARRLAQKGTRAISPQELRSTWLYPELERGGKRKKRKENIVSPDTRGKKRDEKKGGRKHARDSCAT